MRSAHNVAPPESEHELSPDDFELDSASPERAESELRRTRRSNLGLYVFAMVLSGAAAGLGIYAWHLVNEKEQLRSDVAKLVQVRDETQARVAQLVQESGEQQARTAQSDAEREQLRTALASATGQL